MFDVGQIFWCFLEGLETITGMLLGLSCSDSIPHIYLLLFILWLSCRDLAQFCHLFSVISPVFLESSVLERMPGWLTNSREERLLQPLLTLLSSLLAFPPYCARQTPPSFRIVFKLACSDLQWILIVFRGSSSFYICQIDSLSFTHSEVCMLDGCGYILTFVGFLCHLT